MAANCKVRRPPEEQATLLLGLDCFDGYGGATRWREHMRRPDGRRDRLGGESAPRATMALFAELARDVHAQHSEDDDEMRDWPWVDAPRVVRWSPYDPNSVAPDAYGRYKDGGLARVRLHAIELVDGVLHAMMMSAGNSCDLGGGDGQATHATPAAAATSNSAGSAASSSGAQR